MSTSNNKMSKKDKAKQIYMNRLIALDNARIRRREALRKKSIPVYDIVYHNDILSVEDFEQLYSMLSDSIHLLMQAKPKRGQVLIYKPLLTKSMNLATHGWPEYVKISEIPSLIDDMYKKRSDFIKYYCSVERILNEKQLEKIEQEFQEEWAQRPCPSDLHDPYYG